MIGSEIRLRELEHRFRNILTIVRAVVSQSLQSADSLEGARGSIDDRLAALTIAFEQLLSTDWQATTLPAGGDCDLDGARWSHAAP